MAIQLRPLESIAAKFAARAQAAAPEYGAGIANPKVDQAAAAIAGADAYNQGVQEAISAGRFQSGVRKAGTAKWQERSKSLGVQRYPQGVAASKGDYATGFAPYAQVLASISLPARGPRGSGQNLERVRVVADALTAKRKSGGS